MKQREKTTSYVRLAADTSIPLAAQDRMIREADTLTPDNPFDIRTLEGSHLPLARPPEARRRTARKPRGALTLHQDLWRCCSRCAWAQCPDAHPQRRLPTVERNSGNLLRPTQP